MASRRKDWAARAVVAALIALVAHVAAIALFVALAGDVAAPLASGPRMVTAAPPRDREEVAAKARERAAVRYGR